MACPCCSQRSQAENFAFEAEPFEFGLEEFEETDPFFELAGSTAGKTAAARRSTSAARPVTAAPRAQAPEAQALVEGPHGQRPARQLSRGGQTKVWEGTAIERARDIADDDMPWNDPAERSPANYIRVLDYFNVADPSNGRYAPTSANTYCNIYVHDVTRALRATIPHWVYGWVAKPGAPNAAPLEGWAELNANRTADWLKYNGRTAGWFCIDQRLVSWLHAQHTRQQSIPYEDPAMPSGILSPAGSIASATHANPALLLTDAYVAQQLANLGLPTVIASKVTGGIGHVEMVRPERPGQSGQPKNGGFIPVTSRAGASNWRAGLAQWIQSTKHQGRRFYVHS